MPETPLQCQSYPLKTKGLFPYDSIFVDAGKCWGSRRLLPYPIAQTVTVPALCFLSHKWVDFSSCKINIFHYRVTWSAELESILVLLGLKCEQPQIFQELETSKSGSGFAFPWKASMVHTHPWYALLCFSGEVTV